MNQFSVFQLPPALNEALAAMGYETPTPVQAQAIPLVLEGKDVLATAQTGTGKTAAFALPLLKKMIEGDKRPALIVAPTRELAEQIGRVLGELTKQTPHLKTVIVIGGTSHHHQIRGLRGKPMFVVGTPGRLLDQIRSRHLDLSNYGTLVIDEADRLLDMGFEPQMNELVAHLPSERQSLLFSATLPPEIVRLANSYLREPARVSVGEVSKPVDRIQQKVVHVTAENKDQTLIRELDKVAGSIIIFTKTKWKTEKLAKFLINAGHYVARIHGDRSQNQRSGAIRDFREGTVRILVATDIAARGLDIPHIQHVVNYDLPMCPEDYIHRIGRTARAGAEGNSLAFVTPSEHQLWARIHKLMYGRLPDDMPGAGRGPNRADRRATQNRTQGRGHSGRRGDRDGARDQQRTGGPAGGRRRDERGPRPGGQKHAAGPGSRGQAQFERQRDEAPAAPSGRKGQARPLGPSPRRANEMLADKFLKDERRQARPERAESARPGAPRAAGPKKPYQARSERPGRPGSGGRSEKREGQESRQGKGGQPPRRSHGPGGAGAKKQSRWQSFTRALTGR